MKVLVTGGAGFIGSHLTDRLIDEGHEVVVVDDMSGGTEDNVNPKAKLIYADCRDLTLLLRIFKRHRPEIVYDLAANAAEGKSHFSPVDITSRSYDAFIKTLVAGLNNGMRRMVVASSVAVYGSAKAPFTEETKPEPEDVYGVSKLKMEETLKILSKVHGFEYAIARLHNVYGPRQSMRDPYRNVVMIWMNKMLHGEPYVIYGDGSMKRCYTYVSDAVDGLYKLGFEDVNEEIFNIGADDAISLRVLSDTVQAVSGGKVPPQFLPARPQEVNTAVLDHSKAKKRLNYKTEVNILDGIRNTWEWAKSQGPTELEFTDYEIDSPKIPANWKQ